MSKVSHAFAAAVRAARKKHGLSQLQLAEQSGLSLDAIGAIEREVNVPSIESAAKLIVVLGISADAVFNANSASRNISAERGDIEAAIALEIEQMDDCGAALALDICRAVAKAHPTAKPND